MDLKQICSRVIQTAEKTGHFIYNEIPKIKAANIESKSLHNFVTYVDKTSEAQLVHELSAILPEAGFIAEEGTSTKQGGRCKWIIDPLDGTTNFIHGLPPFAISIALMEDDEVILGVVNEVVSKETFYTWKDSCAYLNGHEINVSSVTCVKDSLIATGFPYTDFDKINPFMKTLEYFFNHSHGVRRLGSAAIDMAYLACGRFEGFYEYGLSPWDVAASALIIQQAGGKICDFRGGKNYIFGREIICGSPGMFDEFYQVIHDIMVK